MAHSLSPLVSTELEAPVASLLDGRAAPPDVFRQAWERLAGDTWTAADFGVTRERPGTPECISPDQALVTDTGPTLELVTAPEETFAGVQRQVTALQTEARDVLDDLGYAMLGCGVHPGVRAVPADYYEFRTPRVAYDYAINERSWRHWTIIDIAAAQEVVDVPFADAPRAVRVLHRLAGLMNFVLRNDPDLFGDRGGRLSVRPQAWRDHVPQAGSFSDDGAKVGLPAREICTWRDYLSLLWEASPMFLVGTKESGAAWIPEHPTFLRFLESAPPDGWPARTLNGETVRVRPEAAHVETTDWTYLGFARIRWKWRPTLEGGVEALLAAWRTGDIEAFLDTHLEKVVVENRCNSAQPPGDSLVSLALVSGLLANLDEVTDLVLREPYAFWASMLEASTTEPLDSEVAGRSVREYAREMLSAARRGLCIRKDDEAATALGALDRRVDEGRSPAEELLATYRSGGMTALLERARV